MDIWVTDEMIDKAHAVDLVGLIERDLSQQGYRRGKEIEFLCPFHNDHHPSLKVKIGTGLEQPIFKCFSCGTGGTGAIGWVIKFRELKYKEAVVWLNDMQNVASSGGGQAARQDPAPVINQPMGGLWQERARQIIDGAHNCLFSEEGFFKKVDWRETDPETGQPVTRSMAPIDYLFFRGLTEETLRTWKIGYIPRRWSEKAERWGLSGKDVTIYQGILIPCVINNQVWYLKIRAPVPIDGKKYIQVSKSKPALYMVQTLEWNETVIFTEGEFDALLLWQEIEDMAGVVTLGSASAALNVADWGLYLLHTKNRLIAYDIDERGEEGASKIAWLGNSRRIKVPCLRANSKDITDYWRSGGDLRAWVLGELEKVKG